MREVLNTSRDDLRKKAAGDMRRRSLIRAEGILRIVLEKFTADTNASAVL